MARGSANIPSTLEHFGKLVETCDQRREDGEETFFSLTKNQLVLIWDGRSELRPLFADAGGDLTIKFAVG